MHNSNFEQIDETRIQTLGLTLQQYRHTKTGAQHFHLASDDDNNAFMVAFPTLPSDSTGVAHILEHTTLCGSRRFPVRDPFFMMLRRSLNTYMNAFTSGDTTAYPFATQNRKDYYNLLSVYLDAVFFPRLDALDFAQEGWRVEPGEDDSSLEYHGVVFNEMKGAMSSPVAQLWQHVHTAIFPDAVYRHNSGGDPLQIPELTHEALLDFHRRHYQPGNAVLMTYGDLPVDEHQKQFEDLVFNDIDGVGERLLSPLQAPMDEPVYVSQTYQSEEAAAGATHIVWAWLLGDAADPQSTLECHFLSALLLEHSASPLRKLLETTDLAQAPSELCGIDDSARQLLFICGVEGSAPEHAQTLQQQIIDLLTAVAESGVGAHILDAIVDRLELAQRDISGGNYPYGLQLMGRLLPAATYGGDPVKMLDLQPAIENLRNAIADNTFVQQLLRNYLLNNKHMVRITMAPNAERAEHDLATEQAQLASRAAGLDTAAWATIKADTEALAARQLAEDDENILPKVTLGDVPSAKPLMVPRQSEANVITDFYECAANGVFRTIAAYPIPALTPEEIRAFPLFCEYLTELGAHDEDYLTTQSRRALCGDFSASALVRPRLEAAVDALDGIHSYLLVSAKGLNRKRVELISNVHELVTRTRFDEIERVKDLLLQSRAESEQLITDRGHLIAVASAASSLTPAAELDACWSGPAPILWLKQHSGESQVVETARALLTTFTAIQQKFAGITPRVALIGDAEGLAAVDDESERFIGARTKLAPFVLCPGESQPGQAWIANAQVNFCARAFRGPAASAPDAPVLSVLGRYLQDGFLHREIREHGGAYGSGAGYDPDSATFRMFSYRDPRSTETFSSFRDAVAWGISHHDPQRLEESILGAIRALDQPTSPSGEAERSFIADLCGRSNASRARFREGVLSVTFEQLVAASEQYLQPGQASNAAVGSLGSEQHWQALGLTVGYF